jgi:lysosomal Pro-X carboxypeptidase
MQGFSNIFFSNGMLDPWSGGSPVEYLSRSLDTEYISMAAHHLDLRSPNALDPESVVKARQHEIDAIQSWLNEFNEATITSNK